MAPLTRNVRLRLPQGVVFWREVGRGSPIVFLHGNWQDSTRWDGVCQHLSDRHHCLALDLLGFGESERPRQRCAIALEVETVAAWLTQINLDAAVFVAEGVGAWVATQLALQHPERVLGLVLQAPEGVAVGYDRWRRQRWLAGRFPLLGWGVQAIAPLGRWLGWRQAQHWLAERQQLRRSPTACQLLFRRRHRTIKAELLNEQIPMLKVPLLLLQSESAAADIAACTRIFASAPLAETRHCPVNDWPAQAAAFAQIIQTWIAQQRS